jgi:hypothetical protein
MRQGDFATGMRSAPPEPGSRPTFATGMCRPVALASSTTGDFACGLRELAVVHTTGDFATGLRRRSARFQRTVVVRPARAAA